MNEIKRSDEILQKASIENRSLTLSERGELREAYLWEEQESERIRSRIQTAQKDFKVDDEERPRHIMHGKCAAFQECPLDYKCRAYDPKYIKCVNCVLHETDGICHKKELHNERNIAMMVTRPRVEIK